MSTPEPRPPPKSLRASRTLRGVMVGAALTLPMLSLVVLGSLWLWQHQAVIIWSASAAVVASIIYGLERLLVDRIERQAGGVGESGAPPEILTRREEQAWDAVEAVARKVDPDTLTSQSALFQLGVDTVEAVAREMHPDDKDPLWRFTVPEALAVIGRASSEMTRFVSDNIPLGDRLTVGQLMMLYRWRTVVTAAEKAYDLWRILRLANPAAAIAGEVRERLSGRIMEGMRTEFARRLARAYVREVGRAAVDLYSGRLKPDVEPAREPEPRKAAPVSVLLLGQEATGRTSLALALAGEAAAAVATTSDREDAATITLTRDGDAVATLIDGSALTGKPQIADAIVDRALAADAILWVVSATRPDRQLDAVLLARIRDAYASRTGRRVPPVTVAVTHVDRVRPFREWSPPYDLAAKDSEKAASIREAIDAVAADLRVETADIVPIMAAPGQRAYNVDVLWARLLNMLPEARKAQLARDLAGRGDTRLDWGRLWTQAVNAGRVVGKAIISGGRKPD